MEFNIITLFPEMFGACPSKLEERSGGPLSESILKRAQEKDLIKIVLHQLRDYAEGKHKTVDDTPYGGGKGMVIKVDVVDKAISKITRLAKAKPRRKDQRSKFRNKRTILLSPRGRRFNQDIAKELTKYDNLILICGHYEGFDERVRDLVDEEISIGDFVLTGGEIPAMAIVDAVSRQIKGVLGNDFSLEEKRVNGREVYTRPDVYEHEGKKYRVPKVLLSGNHKDIEEWKSNGGNN